MAAYALPSTLVSSDASVCVGPGYAPGSVNLKSHALQTGIFACSGTPGGVAVIITPQIRELTSLTTPIIATVNQPDAVATTYLLRAEVVIVTAAVVGVSAATYGIRFTVSANFTAASAMTINWMAGNVYTTAVP